MKIKESKKLSSAPRCSMTNFLSASTKPNAIQEAAKKVTQEKLGRGETVVGKDENGIYFTKKQGDGKIEKEYHSKDEVSSINQIR